jgi:hypothetical protein
MVAGRRATLLAQIWNQQQQQQQQVRLLMPLLPAGLWAVMEPRPAPAPAPQLTQR